MADTTEEELIGRLTFAESSKQTREADWHVWIANEKDGDPLSEKCSYVGHVEHSLRLSVVNDAVCYLEPGKVYFLNMAYCQSDVSDVACRLETALTGIGTATVYVEPKY